LYYNFDTDYFFDLETPFIQPLLEEYLKCKDNKEEVKSNFRSMIIKELGSEATKIKGEHLRLSQSFGIAVGLVNNYKYVSFSILSCCRDTLSQIKSNTFSLKKYVTTSFSNNLLNLLKVTY
jgi:hypothetical protein